MQGTDEVIFNGIDATTGAYSLPAIPVSRIAKAAAGETLDADELAALVAKDASTAVATLGVQEGVNPDVLAEAGWGVVFSNDADPEIRAALAPLLDRRRSEALDHYRELSGPDGYRPNESIGAFLKRFGIGPASAVNPDLLPYYLLLVGSPEAIPFRFQYQLDIAFAVGRLHFETVEEYGRYAAAVVAAEKADDDLATSLSADRLLTPLSTTVAAGLPGWTMTTAIGPGQATKQRLGELLGGAKPSLLFTASHGMTFPDGNPDQRKSQGALLCQDWPGPRNWTEAIPPAQFFGGDDVADAAGPGPMIAFLFACYGAGTPKTDDFIRSGAAPLQIAPEAFVSGLPKRLLGHPASPALAVVGHVERAMSYSFTWPGVGDTLEDFRSVLASIAKGRRVGNALEFLNVRYAHLSATLSDLQENATWDPPNDTQVAALWTARNDARNYVILGDPAVRLQSA
jgi:hypothetical protein